MKFDGFRHPREQIAPITLAGTIRNQPVRLLFYRTPFLGLFFTIGFVLLPYIGHKFCSRKKGFDAPAEIAFESNHNGRVRHSVTMMMLEAICRIEFKAQRDLMLVHGVEDHFPCYSD
ncbi:hypothetical protein T4E_7978 [Trichinella pseudospiralis]|uniref:Uncharacterized protein n=1 Tax=Trichinella pseudospiralis TaxID=6337 RepID=A0A0V0YF85_TRIPS|nr:hypothetical protein T4E_7978 [Trichinella pseudospiralis]